MAFKFVGSLITGTPPIAPPANLEKFECSANVNAGELVKLEANGMVSKCNTNMTDCFGLALEDGLSADDDKIRVAILMPGVIAKAPAEGATQVGDTVGPNSDLNGFDDGSLATWIVLRYEADFEGESHMIWAVPTISALF